MTTVVRYPVMPDAETLSERDVRDVIERLVNTPYFTERDAEIKAAKLLIYGQRPVVIPGIDLKVVFQSPELEAHGHNFKKRMLASKASINVRAQAERPMAQERAAKLEKYFLRHYARWLAQMIFDGSLFNMAVLGLGFLHPFIKPEFMPQVPDPDKGESPDDFIARAKTALADQKDTIFGLEGVQPETVYWSDDWTEMVYKAKVPLNPLRQQYAMMGKDISLNTDGHPAVGELAAGVNTVAPVPGNHYVTVMSFETADYIYQIVDHESSTTATRQKAVLVGHYPNIFGKPTFVPVAGEVTGDPSPILRYRSLLGGLYKTVPIKNLLYTMMLGLGMKAVQEMQVLIDIDKDNPTGPVEEIHVLPNGIIQLPPGKRLEQVHFEAGADLPRSIEVLKQEERNYGFPEALAHPEQVTATSGFDRQRQQDPVSNLLEPALGHFGSALREVLLMQAHAIKVLDIPVLIRTIRESTDKDTGLPQEVAEEIRIEPGDVEDIDLKVSFDSKTQFARIAENEEDIKLKNEGLLTETEILAKRVDDVPEWRRMRRREAVEAMAEARALEDVAKALDAIRAGVLAEAAGEADMPDDLTEQFAPPQNGTGEALSVPTGPGTAQAITPPVPEEVTAPTGETGAEVIVG